MFDSQKQKKLDKRYQKIIQKTMPKHLGIILDGNGRWAQKKGLPRIMGHAMGLKRIEEIIPACKKLGIEVLTLFVFSTENWSRPKEEVDFLMNEAKKMYDKILTRISSLDYNIRIIGEIPKEEELKEKVLEINKLGDNNKAFTVCVAFNYGGQKEIINATKEMCKLVKDSKINIDDIDEEFFEQHLYTKNLPSVDLLVRTSGEMRISNFLLWQISYAEMAFPKCYWPAFDTKALYDVIEEYQKRNRRFGKIGEKNA